MDMGGGREGGGRTKGDCSHTSLTAILKDSKQ